MKVKIMQRNVYHKYAEVEIELPKGIDEFDNMEIQDYINDNEHLWCDKLQVALYEASLDDGFGMHTGNWTDHTEESEWRYEVNGNGGHL